MLCNDFHRKVGVRRPNFPRFGSDYFSTEDSLIRAKYVLYGTDICNVEWKVGEKIATYDPFESLYGRSTDNTLEFYS